MDCHLVTVEVSVKCSTHEWVQVDCLAFNEHWLECLDTKTVQGRCAVQKNWVFLNYVFENVPHLWATTLNHALCTLDVLSKLKINKALHYERLEELKCHQLRQTALVQLKGWAGHDDRTTRVVHALTEKVLAETTLLTLQHVR